MDADDWVGAFNGDVCVGARQWDTSSCNGNICEVMVMGYDAWNFEETAGYCMMGDIPSFKIYDASEDTYVDAYPSENFPWSNNGFEMIDSLSDEMSSISGCIDENACNYNPDATVDDGSCIFASVTTSRLCCK